MESNLLVLFYTYMAVFNTFMNSNDRQQIMFYCLFIHKPLNTFIESKISETINSFDVYKNKWYKLIDTVNSIIDEKL